MLRFLEKVITDDFLKKIEGGLILIYNMNEQTSHAGWIEKAERKDKEFEITLAKTVFRRHCETQWTNLESFNFKIDDISNITAIEENFNGYHCSDSSLKEPNFKIFPASSIPEEYEHEHAVLIEYGKAMK